MSEKTYFRSFCSFVLFLLIISLLTHKLIFIYLAILFLFLGILFPRIGKILYKGTIYFTNLNTKVFLFLLFIFFFTPFSFLRKIINRDTLNLKKKKMSFWEEIDFSLKKEDFENMG